MSAYSTATSFRLPASDALGFDTVKGSPAAIPSECAHRRVLVAALVQMRRWVGYAGGALNGERSADGQAGEPGRAVRRPTLQPRRHHSVRALVPSVQTEPARLGRDDGGAWPVAGPYDHLAMGPALYPGIRETLAPLCACSRPVVAG